MHSIRRLSSKCDNLTAFCCQRSFQFISMLWNHGLCGRRAAERKKVKSFPHFKVFFGPKLSKKESTLLYMRCSWNVLWRGINNSNLLFPIYFNSNFKNIFHMICESLIVRLVGHFITKLYMPLFMNTIEKEKMD